MQLVASAVRAASALLGSLFAGLDHASSLPQTRSDHTGHARRTQQALERLSVPIGQARRSFIRGLKETEERLVWIGGISPGCESGAC